MAINKVVLNDEVKLDLTEDTVTADKLIKGVTAHNSAGNSITGTLELAKVATSGSYNDLSNKPEILTRAVNGFSGAICAGSDGVAEYGKYCDFHSSADTTSDYSTRLTCTGDYKNNVNLPSANGTLVIGDKAYKIVTSSSAPTANDTNVITFVI